MEGWCQIYPGFRAVVVRGRIFFWDPFMEPWFRRIGVMSMNLADTTFNVVERLQQAARENTLTVDRHPGRSRYFVRFPMTTADGRLLWINMDCSAPFPLGFETVLAVQHLWRRRMHQKKIRRRLALAMAWHPRLGQRSAIACIPGDLALRLLS